MSARDGRVVRTAKIVDHGPASARWNLVVLSEGYREPELAQFAGDAERFCETLFATPPFDALRTAINVFRVDVASTDSGADDPAACDGTGATPATFFDASFCNGGLRRSLQVDTALVMETATDQVPEWHVVIVVVNSPVYGGSGADGVPVYSLASQAERIALHELGHSAFGLADEYADREGCGSAETDDHRYVGDEPVEPNVTADPSRRTLKWRDLVRGSTALPTTANADCTECDPQPNPVADDTVGAFEGARYFHCGLYRPQYTCLMQESAEPFCAVCTRRIRETLTPFLPKRSPMNYSVIVNQRNHFGNEPDFLPGVFAGRRKDFSFDCPGVDSRQQSVLMMQTQHVSVEANVFTVNGTTVFGNVPQTTEDKDAWAAQVLLVNPNVLRSSGNILHVEARTGSGSSSGDVDDFVIDNVVLMYKTG